MTISRESEITNELDSSLEELLNITCQKLDWNPLCEPEERVSVGKEKFFKLLNYALQAHAELSNKQKELDRLRAALSFYAEWWPEGVEPDGGALARKALQEEGK